MLPLLPRYLLRQLALPFCYALVSVTSVMLLSQVAKRLGDLTGKGLPGEVITEVFVLSLPFLVAMTFPMAVLIAVLYAIGQLAADNEVTAMRASGIGVPQLVRPLLAWGLVMAAINFLFVDQVLPRSNARLRTLLLDISRKRPTFQLREQVINEIPGSGFSLRAGRIDPGSGRLRDVTIYDIGGAYGRRIIHADSARMAYADGGRDLALTLYAGTIHQIRSAEPTGIHVIEYGTSQVRIRNVFDKLDRTADLYGRGDREMNTCEMLAVIDSARQERLRFARERATLAENDARMALGGLPLAPLGDSGYRRHPLPSYCRVYARFQQWLVARTTPPRIATTVRGLPPVTPDTAQGGVALGGDSTRPASPSAGATPAAPVAPPPPATVRLEPPRLFSSAAQVANSQFREQDAVSREDRFSVEVHKKWAISLACPSFVLIGLAMALRFPRGGVGLVIGGGLAVFSIYYVGLQAGETLADRQAVEPWIAMWAANILLTGIGIAGLWLVNRESGSTRGGDLAEIVDGARWLVRRLGRPRRPGRPDGGDGLAPAPAA